MKLFLSTLLFILSTTLYSQASAKVEFDALPEKLVAGEDLIWKLSSNQEVQLELAIFSNDYLGFQANAELTTGKHEYLIKTESWPAGKYFILAKGEHIHVQAELIILKR